MTFRQLAIAVMVAGLMPFGAAFAGDSGGYYVPGSDTAREPVPQRGRPAASAPRVRDWRSAPGAADTGGGTFLRSPYIAARGGMAIYSDRDGSVTSGYNPADGVGNAAPFDISRITGSGTGDADLGGSFALAVGAEYNIGIEYGAVRSELEIGYHLFSSDTCFTGIPGVNPNAPGTELGRRLQGTGLGGAFTSEGAGNGPVGPQYPGITSDRATAQTNFEGRLSNVCITYDKPAYHAVLNNFWDFKLAGLAALGNTDLGALAGLEISLGAGIGYILMDDERGQVELLLDAHEPRYGDYEETAAVGKVFDRPTPNNVRTRTGTGLIQYVPRSENGARNRDPNRDTSAEADTDLDSTIGRAPEMKSGLYVPVSVVFGYNFASILDVPVRAEITYRYNVVAPKALRKAHGILLGVRYTF